MLRVAITGSHSTGKTTLTRALAEALTAKGLRCRLANEPRNVLESRAVRLDQRDVYVLLIAEHLRRLDATAADVLLLDRSLSDLRAYLRNEPSPDPVLSELVDVLLRWYVPRIDLWLYLPIEFALVPDGRRPPSEEYRRAIDGDLRASATRIGIAATEIRGTPEQRLEQALAAVDKALSQRSRAGN